jgi:hypothetical protein
MIEKNLIQSIPSFCNWRSEQRQTVARRNKSNQSERELEKSFSAIYSLSWLG